MAKVQHTCTGCVPIDASIIDVYVTLVETNKFVTTAEADRVIAEEGRVSAESGRVSAEEARVRAEDGRVDAESLRVSAEETRQENERGRQQGEENRNTQYAIAEGSASSTAGDGSRWGSYKSAEAERDAISAEDHRVALADHGTAGDDHTLAVADHGTAGEDHTAATSATARANAAAEAAEHMVDIKQGPKGDQGNTGSSVDYPYELVNNLTTDDATKGLSAAQGVVMDGKVTQLEAKVDGLANEVTYPSFTVSSGDIGQDGTIHPNANYRYTSDIPVKKGQRMFVKTAGYGVCVIAKRDGNTLTSLVYVSSGSATVPAVYSYYATEDCNLVACFKNTYEHEVALSWKVSDDILALQGDLGESLLHRSSLFASDIYTSTTGNFLDTYRVIKGFFIKDGNGTIRQDARGVCSGFIYVGDIAGTGSITVSGYISTQLLYLSFISDAEYQGKHISTYTMTGTSRTLSVPSGAKYVFVSLFNPFSLTTEDYHTIKLSKTASATTDNYNGKYLGSAFHPEVWNKTIASTEMVENAISGVLKMSDLLEVSETDQMLDYTKRQIGVRVSDVSPYIKTDLSAAVSSPYIPVIGVTKIKLTNLPSWSGITFSRYLAFTTDRSGTAASVIVSSIVSVSNNLEVTVPATAKYLIFVMGSNTAHTEADMAKIKVSRSGGFTYDEYKGKKLLYTYTEYESGVPYYSEDPLAENRDWLPGETARVQKEFLPYSIGSPSESVSMSGQYNRVNILMFTDSHIDLGANNGKSSVQNVEDTIAFAKKSGVFDAIINAGDIITPFGVNTKESQKTKAASFFNPCKTSAIPVIFSVGNHDTNDWFNTAENAFNDADWGEMWLDWAEQNYGIVRQTKQSGDKSTWHYYDIASKKIRIICLDVQDVDKELTNESGKVIFYGGVAFYISNEQFNWMANTALNFDDKAEKDWGVVIVSHQGTEYGVGVRNANNGDALANWVGGTAYVVGNLVKYNDAPYRCNTANSDASFDSSKWDNLSVERDINKFSAMLKAFNEQSSYSMEYTCEGDSFYDLSVNADWTRYANLEKKPFVVCWVLGHEHLDKNEVVNGIQMIWTLNGSCTASSSDARVARIAETPLQNAFDCISIDPKTRKIRYVRFGAGRNCYGVGGDRFLPDGLSF